MESIELRIDENNEVTFKIAVTGAEEEPSVRFVCEGAEISYMFKGSITEDGDVRVIIPPMKGKIRENETLKGTLEVMVEGRVFQPLQVNTKFAQPMKVVAESVQVRNSNPIARPAPAVTAVVTKAPVVTQVKPMQQVTKQKPIKESSPAISDEMVASLIRKLNSQK